MKNPLLALFLFLGLFSFLFSSAQDVPPGLEREVEERAAADQLVEEDNIIQQLAYYRKHPLNLNEAGEEQLKMLPGLSPVQIQQFLRYRKLVGKLIDLYELQAIPYWDSTCFEIIRPYVYLGPAETLGNRLKLRLKGDHRLLLAGFRQWDKEGSQDDFLGSPYRIWLRYTYQFKDLLYWGITADKDAGEAFFRGAERAGFDFYSLHLFARNLGIVKALALGDFSVNLGQGLLEWQALAFGKSTEIGNIIREAPVLLPYRSAGEYLFNRGFGLTLGCKKMEATVFASSRKISAHVNRDSLPYFTSIETSGYHRTAAEIRDRNQVVWQAAGGNLAYRSGAFHMGWNLLYYRFSLPLYRGDQPYQRFLWAGRHWAGTSMDFGYTLRNMHVFGETAFEHWKPKATVFGILLSVDRKADLSFLYRGFSRNYGSLTAKAFEEGSAPANEQGLYAGLSLRPSPVVKIALFADVFSFPWLRYRVNAPAQGFEYQLQLDYVPTKKISCGIRIRTKNDPLNNQYGNPISYPEGQAKNSVRFYWSDQLTRKLLLTSRMEWLQYEGGSPGKESGFLLLMEGKFVVSRRFNLLQELEWFQTDGYDSRIYAYEKGVPGQYSIPALFGKGLRYTINFHFDMGAGFQFWGRWGQSFYPGNLYQVFDERQNNLRQKADFQGEIVMRL